MKSPLMTDEQVAGARRRAEDVVNGFLLPRTQNARDALELAGHATAQAATIASLTKKLQEKGTGLFSDLMGGIGL